MIFWYDSLYMDDTVKKKEKKHIDFIKEGEYEK